MASTLSLTAAAVFSDQQLTEYMSFYAHNNSGDKSFAAAGP